MSLKQMRIKSIEGEIMAAVEELVETRVREALARASADSATARLQRAVQKLSREALDPDPDSLTDEEKQDFVRRSTLAY